jgi:hypothetical protein
LFGEECRRLKIVPNAFGEKPVLKLMFAALIRAAETGEAYASPNSSCVSSTKRTGRRLRDLDRPIRQDISAASFQQVRALTVVDVGETSALIRFGVRRR